MILFSLNDSLSGDLPINRLDVVRVDIDIPRYMTGSIFFMRKNSCGFPIGSEHAIFRPKFSFSASRDLLQAPIEGKAEDAE